MNCDTRSTGSALLVSLLLVASFGCSPTAKILTQDYMGVTKGVANAPSGRSLYSGGGLVGPHFSVKIDSAAVTSDLDPDTAKRLGFDSARQAATGHEILLVRIAESSPAIRPRWDPKDGNISIAVVVAGGERPLAALPGLYEVLVVSVPEHAPVLLRVTDDGRALTMNLRDGSVPPESVYQVSESRPLNPSEYQGNGTVTAAGLTRPLKVEVKFAEVSFRESFLPGLGWAAPGRTWLWFQNVLVSSDAYSLKGVPGSTYVVSFNLDMAATFSFLLADGTTVRAQAGGVDAALGSPFNRVVFDVPDSVLSGTLRITPAGEMKAPFKEGEIRTDWSQPPAAGEIVVSFSG